MTIYPAQDPLAGKTVLILGFARQGRALARWLPTVGARAIASDSRTATQLGVSAADFPDVALRLGDQDLALLDGVDVLCVSGGVPLDLPIVQAAQIRGIPLANDAQFFLERCPAPVFGITGSAGKTTTTALTGEIARAAGFRTWVGGNIGDVLLDELARIRPTDRVVMELSSFQLELMTVSPEFACITNITPNHLDRHGTMENYIRAKAHILLHQDSPKNAVILGRDNAATRDLAGDVLSQLGWFSMAEIVPDGAFLAGERLVLAGISSADGRPHVIGERDDIRLRGDHNVQNVLAACALTGAASIKPDIMIDAIRAFRGVPHRLEVVRVREGVTWVNDSIATAPERVVAALRSYSEPVVLLLGGRDKNLPWEEMLALALQRSRRVIVFGEVAEMVLRLTRTLGAASGVVVQAEGLEQAVRMAANAAQAGDVVLLSPGGTSYDAYVDFAARGAHYRELVGAL